MMDINEKNALIKEITECIEVAADLDSDDSDKEEILIRLTNVCNKATHLSTERIKRQWVKPRRENRAKRGLFTFLTKELLLNDEAAYSDYLRVTKNQFVALLTLVQQDITRCDTVMRQAIPAAEKLALTLRFLASGESFQNLDKQTRLSKSSICNIVPEVCDALLKQLKNSYLKFPSNQLEWEDISKEFALKWQFPNCLGALDGKQINLRPSRKDGELYHSIILMALVDANCKFIFVDVGCNGRSNDADAFLQSKLSTILKEEKDIPKNAVVGNGRRLPYVIVGDDAFPMQIHLMKPYPYHTNSTEKQIFNARLFHARHVVERAFEIVTDRFRIFLAPVNVRVDTVQKITLVCCALHNFLLEREENYVYEYSPPGISDVAVASGYNTQNSDAEVVRQQYMAYFNNEGKLDWLQPNT